MLVPAMHIPTPKQQSHGTPAVLLCAKKKTPEEEAADMAAFYSVDGVMRVEFCKKKWGFKPNMRVMLFDASGERTVSNRETMISTPAFPTTYHLPTH